MPLPADFCIYCGLAAFSTVVAAGALNPGPASMAPVLMSNVFQIASILSPAASTSTNVDNELTSLDRVHQFGQLQSGGCARPSGAGARVFWRAGAGGRGLGVTTGGGVVNALPHSCLHSLLPPNRGRAGAPHAGGAAPLQPGPGPHRPGVPRRARAVLRRRLQRGLPGERGCMRG